MSDEIHKKLDKLETKIDSISDKLENVNITLARNTDSLIIHEKRSDANEENLELLRKEFEPVKQHVFLVNTLVKIGVAGVSLIYGIKKLGLF